MQATLAAPQALIILPELAHEITITRRVLERVPAASFDWQPHPKSMTLGGLASHTADMLSFLAATLHTERIDLGHELAHARVATTPAELLQRLAEGAAAAQAALTATDDDAYEQSWSLCHGEQVIMQMPRKDVVRHLISHMTHHRGQLSVYLRLLDVPVPSIYGPSADEPQG